MSERVAVIAIHGVGDHQPAEMGKAVAEMLENLKDGDKKPRYGCFRETTLLVNVSPVKVEEQAFKSVRDLKHGRGVVDEHDTWGPLDALLKASPQQHRVHKAKDADIRSLDHLFMEGQLAKYNGEGPEDTYEEMRLEGVRFGGAPHGPEQAAGETAASDTPRKDVHVYDMFWSDLSGVGTKGLRIFGELYQLLFHLGSIGVNNVKAAAISLRDTAAAEPWRRFDTAQQSLASLLAQPVPILNLLLLVLAAGVVADSLLVRMTATMELIVTAAFSFLLVTAWAAYRVKQNAASSYAQFTRPLLGFLLACAVAAGLAHAGEPWVAAHVELVDCAATALVLALVFTGAVFIMKAYERRRPNTMRVFWKLSALVGAGVAVWGVVEGSAFLPADGHFTAITICLRAFEATVVLLSAVWVVFWLSMAYALWRGRQAVEATKAVDANEGVRAERTNWTARLTIALPAALFLLLTFALWSGVSGLAGYVVPHGSGSTPVSCISGSIRTGTAGDTFCYTPLISGATVPYSFSKWTGVAMAQAGVGYIPLLLLLVAGAAAIALYGVLPSVMDEVSPPRSREGDLEKDCETLGKWLNNGFRFMRLAGRLLYIGVFLFPVAIIEPLLFVCHPHNAFLKWYESSGPTFAQAMGTIVTGAGIGLLGFSGRLSKLALGLRPVVRVALDVDNWMREHPRDSNPTARICGRYISVLRHVAQWKDKNGKGYDALIVFAHSQGTVITADLFRFIEAEARACGGYSKYDQALSSLDKIPRKLFTMGCPLGQLYGLRFPYLYGYAPAEMSADLLPKPESLGVNEWVNAYRSGDYVGRHLWRDKPWAAVSAVSQGKWDPANQVPKNIWHKGGRVEFSIGPGAHMHYFDSTAEAIAETLDSLIARI